jgi:hypothetical protein
MSAGICTVVITGDRKRKNTKLSHINMTFGTSSIETQYFQNAFLFFCGGGGGGAHRDDDITKLSFYSSTCDVLNDAVSSSKGYRITTSIKSQ